MTNQIVQRYHNNGVSVWLDDLSRTRLETGELESFINDLGITGVTTNPSIFQKALHNNTSYQNQINTLKTQYTTPDDIVQRIMINDVRDACDLFQPIAEHTQWTDGRVSIEVNPHLAHDTNNTITQAQFLWDTINRPNVMIKIPATTEGLPAITETLAQGISVNVTLIFSVERYRDVIDAYLNGLVKAYENGHNLSRIFSVASFFVSRIDTFIDPLLAENNIPLAGKIALANANIAYDVFTQAFSKDPRWEFLRDHGAHVQKILFASTSTKNPAYSDCLYTDQLVATNVVNTMPEKTLMAVADHGDGAVTITESSIQESKRCLQVLEENQISLNEVTATLEKNGISQFIDAWDQMIADLVSLL